MKKILIILVGLFLIAGCSNSNNTGTTKNTFIGGTESAEFDFMTGTPPEEVYDGGQQPFEVTVKIENKGEYDIPKEDLKVKLTGFYPADFGSPTIEKNPEEDLDKSYIDPDGETQKGDITFLNFQGFNFVGTLKGNNQYKIRADVCYKYGTYGQADLCVLDDLTPEEESKEVCKVNERKSVASSSAPVQIQNFEEEVSGTRKVRFSFDVIHSETGFVARLGSSCNDDLLTKNKVWVEVDSGLPGLECSGLEGGSATTGETTLYDNKRKIICMQDLSGVSGDFEKKVNILIKYDYKEYTERDILVKHATQ